MQRRNGLLIILTGINGAGKDTHDKPLAARLDGVWGLPARAIYAPKITPSSTAFRAAVLEGHPQSTFAELLGYMAQHEESALAITQIRTEQPQHIVINRGPETSLIYNGIANKLGTLEMAIARNIFRHALSVLKPDLTIELDISLKESRRRSALQPETDYFQEKEDDYFLRLLEGYKSFRGSEGWGTVDANQGIEEVFEAIWAQVEPITVREFDHANA